MTEKLGQSKENILKRQLLILEKIGEGLSSGEIVTEVAVQGHVSERTVWRDLSSIDDWEPIVLGYETLEKAHWKAMSRLEFIYVTSYRTFLNVKNETVYDWFEETMFIIQRNKVEDMDLKIRFGEDLDQWPDDDDPRWQEHYDAVDKFVKTEREYGSQKHFFQSKSPNSLVTS